VSKKGKPNVYAVTVKNVSKFPSNLVGSCCN